MVRGPSENVQKRGITYGTGGLYSGWSPKQSSARVQGMQRNRRNHNPQAGREGDMYAWMRRVVVSGVIRFPQTDRRSEDGNLVNHVGPSGLKEVNQIRRDWASEKEMGSALTAFRAAVKP